MMAIARLLDDMSIDYYTLLAIIFLRLTFLAKEIVE